MTNRLSQNDQDFFSWLSEEGKEFQETIEAEIRQRIKETIKKYVGKKIDDDVKQEMIKKIKEEMKKIDIKNPAAANAVCSSGAEGIPKHECTNSNRACGHHCNHSWEQDKCCWCGAEFGES